VKKNFIPLLVFCLLIAVSIEASYRFFALGPQALNPLKLNSMRTLLESGLVQAADDPATQFELRPNLDALHSSVRLTTSSAGLADREYSLAKPAGVYRVAVLGSSWTMPTGVEHQAAWHAQIEARLNSRSANNNAASPSYEFINFGVELYGLNEISGTLRTRVMAYEPDLIIVALTTLSTYFVRTTNPQPFDVPPTRNPIFESFALRSLDSQLNLNLFDQRQVRPTLGADTTEHRVQTEAFLREVHAFGEAQQTPVAIVWLGFRPLRQLYEKTVLDTTAELGLPLVLGYRSIIKDVIGSWGADFADPRYRLSRFDSHPNAAGHEKIADEVEQVLFPAP
jgi:hypothetical protein